MALPWSFVPKNTNSKHQITNKSQIPTRCAFSMTKTFIDNISFGFSSFGHWNFFVIWDLLFGIANIP